MKGQMTDANVHENAGPAEGEDWDNFSLKLVCSLLTFEIRQWCGEARSRLHAWMVTLVINVYLSFQVLEPNG
jgi:hypothetical protein